MAEVTSPISPSELPREFHGPLVNEDSIGFQFDRRRRRQEGMKRKKRRPSSFHMNKSESASIADHVLQSISKSNVEAETQQVESKKENPNEIVTTPIAEKLMSIVRDVLNESLIEISAQIDFQSDDTEKVSNDVLENITAEHIQRLLIEMQQQDEVRQILTERINCIKNEQDDWKNYEKGLADQAQTQKDELEKPIDLVSLEKDILPEYQQLLSSNLDCEKLLKELDEKRSKLSFELKKLRDETLSMATEIIPQCEEIQDQFESCVGNLPSTTTAKELMQNILDESSQIQ
ncbi:hypothetical protein TrispH2_000474 [Trichoplax sp. H2]|nr:hypothetical protein TrispH2_000474 [Trichoplax sp. H2]|eukprot:RDD47885.1 hypothetical protein TrispH2_000474 [Trichoplax sp. H2]